MPVETKTFAEIRDLIRGYLRATIDGADVSDLSDYDITARVQAAVAIGLQAQGEFLADQIFPRDAELSYLERHALARGLQRESASAAVLTVLLTGTTAAQVQAAGSVIEAVDGTGYTLDAAATVTLPAWTGKTVADGSTTARIICVPHAVLMSAGDVVTINSEVTAIRGVNLAAGTIDLWTPLAAAPTPGAAITATIGAVATATADDVGTSGAKPPGDSLTIDSPTGDISATATVLAAGSGQDIEGEELLRGRVVSHDEIRPGSGNVGEYRERARAIDGVEDAVVFPNYRGLGAHTIVPIGPESFRDVSDTVVAEVQAALDAWAPPGDSPLVQTAVQSAEEYDVEVTVLAEEGYEPDFAGSFAVAGGTATTVTLGADPTGTIEVGDRVIIGQRFTTRWSLYRRTVVGVGASFIELDAALPAAPSVNADGYDDVFSGGPSGEALCAALLGVYDALGPGAGVSGLGTSEALRVPSQAAAWDDTLRVGSIESAAAAVEGIRTATVTRLLGETSTPSDATPAPLERLRPGLISIVWS